MAERITKVVQGVGNLFDEIVVNGRTVKSTPSAHVALTSQNPPVQASEPVQGEDVEAVQLNDIIHNLKDKELTEAVGNIASLIPSDATSSNKLVTKGYVDLADNGMKNRLDTLEGLVPSTASSSNKLTDKNYVDTEIEDIEELIPSEASTSNQLADKNYVDTEISDAIEDLDVSEVGGNGKYIKSIRQVNGKIEAVEDDLSSVGAGVAFIGTRAQYEQAKLIPVGEAGHIPSGSLVLITDEDAYVEGEDR